MLTKGWIGRPPFRLALVRDMMVTEAMMYEMELRDTESNLVVKKQCTPTLWFYFPEDVARLEREAETEMRWLRENQVLLSSTGEK